MFRIKCLMKSDSPLLNVISGRHIFCSTLQILPSTCFSIILFVFFTAVSAVFSASAVQPLVTTQWVVDNLNSIKIIDVSDKGYAKGHIPGAVQINGAARFLPRKRIIWCSVWLK